MSRSIHRTRRDFVETQESDYADPGQRAAQLEEIAGEIARKQRIKDQIQSERRNGGRQPPPHQPEAIPIRVRDTGQYVHYPASPADLLGVMHRLPAGVLDGLAAIDLCLGVEDQQEYPLEPDPLVGRPGLVLWPGAYGGKVQGVYHPYTAKIRLLAYVYDHEMPDRVPKELFLRLQMLATFAHEVAHHYDWTTRIARGRWRMDSETKDEIYAENVQHEWVRRYVVPYLEAIYPGEVQALDAWIAHHGGISIPLDLLAGDPRTAVVGNAISLEWGGFPGAFQRLAESVARGEKLISTRIGFAEYLHFAEHYTEALAILERVLAEHPEHEETLALQADIAIHQGEYDRAETLCQRVIAKNEEYPRAWEVLCDLRWCRRDWDKLAQTATRALALFEPDAYGWSRALLHRARAHLELSDMQGFKRDHDHLTLASDWRGIQADAMALEAVMLLRTGRYEEALAIALQGAKEYRPPRVELIAVRFEAAQKLGRPYEAGEITPRHIERLRYRGYDDWADCLVKQYGLSAYQMVREGE